MLPRQPLPRSLSRHIILPGLFIIGGLLWLNSGRLVEAAAPEVASAAAASTPPTSATTTTPTSATTPPSARATTAIQLPPGVERRASVEGITEYRLANGLRVLLFPDNSKPTMTVNITYLVGSRHEGYGETGMAHLIEHMIFKGTPKHPKIHQELTAHGSRPNGSTSYDRTNYFETFAATDENLDWALDLEADRMVNSNMAAEDLASEFSVVRNEFELGENYPQGVLTSRVLSAAYLWHNYGKSTIGARADIERVPIQSLRAFYETWYQPDNAVLVVAGAIDEEKTLGKIVSTFGTISKPERQIPSTYTVEPPQDGERQVTLRRVGDVQMVAATYHIPAGTHPDFASVSLMARILGDAPSGRLHKALVEPGKAASVFARPYQLHDPGVLTLGADVRIGASVEEARDILLRTAENLAAKPPAQEEVDRARETLLKYWEVTMRNSERAALNLSEWSALGDWRLMFIHRDRLKKVTPADVSRVAAAYLRRENRTVGIYIPTKEAARVEIPEAPDISPLVAGYKGEEPLAEGEAFEASPAKIESRAVRVQLEPGIKLVMVPKKNRGGTVYGSLTFHFGDESSLQGRSTAADMAGKMLMRGSTAHTRQQIRDEFDRLRALANAGGSATQASASFEVTSENLPATLRLMAELLRKPAFPDSEFAQLIDEELAALEDSRTDPLQVASTELYKHMTPWPKSDPRYVETPDEAVAAVKATTVDQVRKFHEEFYGASKAEIAIVGDFDPAAIKTLIAELFGDWKSPRRFTRLASKFQDRPAINKQMEVPDKESAVLMTGLRIEGRDDDPEYPGLTLGSFMLGGGFLNSRLATRLRQKDGLSYSVAAFASLGPFDRNGTFTGFAIYAPQNSGRLVAGFQEEIARALDKGFTEQEVAEARTGWLQQQQVSRASDRELASRLALREFQGRTLAWDEALETRIAALTNEEIVSAMRKYIDPKKISMVQAGDFAKSRKGAPADKSDATPN